MHSRTVRADNLCFNSIWDDDEHDISLSRTWLRLMLFLFLLPGFRSTLLVVVRSFDFPPSIAQQFRGAFLVHLLFSSSFFSFSNSPCCCLWSAFFCFFWLLSFQFKFFLLPIKRAKPQSWVDEKPVANWNFIMISIRFNPFWWLISWLRPIWGKIPVAWRQWCGIPWLDRNEIWVESCDFHLTANPWELLNRRNYPRF